MKKTGLFKFSKFALVALLSTSALFFTSCGDDDSSSTPAPTPATQNLYEILGSKSELSELKGFIDDFGLASALQSTDPTTFFAPNNAAFDKLRVTLGTDDLATVNPAIIEEVLKFHVIAGNALTKEQLVGQVTVVTVQGESIEMNNGATNSGTIKTGGSDDEVNILEADINATNGRMHVVETILIPPTIFASIGVNLGKLSQPILLGADFTTLAAAIAKADEYATGASLPTLTSILSSDDSTYTVFAPSNGVFTAAGITIDTYTGEQFYGIIANHVVSGVVAAADINTVGQQLSTLAGGTITVLTLDAPTDPDNGILTGIALDSNGDTTAEGQVAVGDAFNASNGVLHVLAGILVP